MTETNIYWKFTLCQVPCQVLIPYHLALCFLQFCNISIIILVFQKKLIEKLNHSPKGDIATKTADLRSEQKTIKTQNSKSGNYPNKQIGQAPEMKNKLLSD